MIVVKYCKIDIIDDMDVERYLKQLPLVMFKEVHRYKLIADRKSRLLARLMLMESLNEEHRGEIFVNWKLDANGKPNIDDWHSFNISHSGEFVIFAYDSQNLIGIDIEKTSNIDYWDILTYFHDEEKRYVESAIQPHYSFYDVWVKKEAFLKAIGTGIINGLNHFNCSGTEVNYEKQRWYWKNIQIHPDYICYLCSLNADCEFIIKEFSLEEIEIK